MISAEPDLGTLAGFVICIISGIKIHSAWDSWRDADF